MLRQELAEGHAINLHSWSHNYKSLYPGRSANAANIESEYLRTIEAVQGILGKDFNTEGWRYPGGHMSWKSMAAADAALAEQGVHWVDWNADTRDSARRSQGPRLSTRWCRTPPNPSATASTSPSSWPTTHPTRS
nr:polysaccharide deacetylase family protein [Tessaracoccus coleopterorum]